MIGIFTRLIGFVCISAIGVMASHANASDIILCRKIELSRGIVGHGATLCHSRWLSGASWLTLSIGSNQCGKNNIHDNDNLLGKGFSLFDGSAKALGLDAACQQLDILLQAMDEELNANNRTLSPDYAWLDGLSNVVLSVRQTDLPEVGLDLQEHSDSELEKKCDQLFLRYDALFVHATAESNKDYMDSDVGLRCMILP
jgi:hypothetical protein